MKKRFALLMLTVFMVVGLFGGQVLAKDSVKIGVSVPVLSNPFWRSFADMAEKSAKALGADVVVMDADQKDSKQLDQIMGLISSGVDGLVITPNTSAIAQALLKQAENANIPVVLAERYPGFGPADYKGDSYVGFVGTDNVLAGYNIAKALYDAGCRKIVAIGGVPGVAVADERRKGLHQFLDEHPDMKLLQEQRNAELREIGMKDTESFLSAFPGPGFDGIWGYNDDSALGAIKALKNAGVVGQVKVAGMDLISEAVDAIKNGEMLFSTGGQWAESAEAVVMVYDAIHGIAPTKPVLELAIPNVTKENVKLYEDKFIKSMPDYNFKDLSQVYNPSAKTTDFEISLY